VRSTLAALFLLVSAQAALAAGGRVTVHDTPREVPAIAFQAEDRTTRSLEDFRGQAVVLDLWATWCLPCRAEFPDLDRLQERRGAEGLVVVPVSLDRKGWPAVDKFYADVGVTHLGRYLDDERKLSEVLGARALPTTLIIDRQGREVARIEGTLDWAGPQADELLARALKPLP